MSTTETTPAATVESPAVTNGQSQTAMISNVAEIFNAAGFAFKKLSELVQQLDNGNGNGTAEVDSGETSNHSHWEPADVEQFRNTIQNFRDGLTHLSANLKNKMSARLHQEHTERATTNATSTTTSNSID